MDALEAVDGVLDYLGCDSCGYTREEEEGRFDEKVGFELDADAAVFSASAVSVPANVVVAVVVVPFSSVDGAASGVGTAGTEYFVGVGRKDGANGHESVETAATAVVEGEKVVVTLGLDKFKDAKEESEADCFFDKGEWVAGINTVWANLADLVVGVASDGGVRAREHLGDVEAGGEGFEGSGKDRLDSSSAESSGEGSAERGRGVYPFLML